MLRYMLLAGAAALALPGATMAQVQWSEPFPGENNASSAMDNPGVLDSPTDYDIPFNQAPTGFNAGDYATAQQDRTRTPIGDAYVPDTSDDTTTALGPQAGNGVYGSQPSGGYYFGTQGDQPLVSPVSQQGSSGPPEGAYNGQSYQGYTSEQGAPSAYEGQGPGSSESPTSGQGLGGEGAFQQGQTTYGYGPPPPSQGYTGGGYYTGEQGAASSGPPPGAYSAPPPSQGYAGPPPGAYSAPPPSQGYTGGGYYTGEQGAYGGQGGYQPNADQDQANNTQVNVPGDTGQPLVIVPATGLTSSKYVRETTAANLYQIRAARIALRRSHSPQVRDYARQMIQEHRQGLVTIIQASFQAGVPERPRMSLAHRLMLARLRRTSARDFDAVYMNQQVVAHMNQLSVQRGYALNGDNSVLQQVASQSDPTVQQHLAVAWNMTGQPERLAARRDSELALLDQNMSRGQTYRGYTVIGPTSTSELERRRASRYRGYAYRGYSTGGAPGGRRHHRRGYYDQFNYNLKGGATGVSYRQSGQQSGQQSGMTGGGYQGYTSGAGAQPGTTGQAGTTGIPGSPGYGTSAPGAQPGTAGTSGYGTGAGIPGTGTSGYGGPQYQGYTSPNQGPGTTTPSTQGPMGAPPYQGSPGSPGYATPGSPGYTTTPGTSPGLASPGSTTPGSTTPGSLNSPNPNSPNPNGV